MPSVPRSELPNLLSAAEGITWPSIPMARAAGVLSVLFQLERSEWWAPGQIAHIQLVQMASVLRHAYETVEFYRERLGATGWQPGDDISGTSWAELPTLSRVDAQMNQERLRSSAVPASHGATSLTATSGSTGRPLTTQRTELVELFWKAFTLRDHLWHRRDLSSSLAVIRQFDQMPVPPGGMTAANWGPATHGLIATGTAWNLGIEHAVRHQAEWLCDKDPAYLLSYPSNVLALAEYFTREGRGLPGLRQVRTFGEVLDPRVRPACDEAWGVPVVDMYSSQEVGYIALQCPEGTEYHVQAEHLLVEVIDEQGRACRPGEVGRVVVSTLHNFAMPLLRYELGDFAEVGDQCGCGRGLPVLSRVLGRQRNMFVLPNGDRRWPSLGAAAAYRAVLSSLPRLRQFQVVQRTVDDLEMKVVADRTFTAHEEDLMRGYLQTTLGHRFSVRFTYVEEISRSSGGKFEDFRSEVEQ